MTQKGAEKRAEQKKYRNPPPRLVGNPFKELDPMAKARLMDAVTGNLVSVVVEDYLAEMRELQSEGPEADSGGGAAEETRDNS